MTKARRRRLVQLTIVGLILGVPSLPAYARLSGALAALPPTVAITSPEKRSGVIQLEGGAYAYLPKGNDDSPMPLLVALHGGPERPQHVLKTFRDYADRHGIVLLMPSAVGYTWDVIVDYQRRAGLEMNVTPRFGKDLQGIDKSLRDLFTKVSVDAARVGVIGFSNGATYALAIGTANPQLFGYVIVFSPGPAFLAPNLNTKQRVFVSHGENDEVWPFSSTRGIVARLRVKKVPVAFEPFKGGHKLPEDIKEKAFDFFMQR